MGVSRGFRTWVAAGLSATLLAGCGNEEQPAGSSEVASQASALSSGGAGAAAADGHRVRTPGPGAGPAPTVKELTPLAPVATPSGGTWTALTNAPPSFLDTCVLLTNGDVMCHQYNSNTWHRLSPDAFGSYKNGIWDNPAIAPMPNGNDPSFGCVNCTYAPLYFASAVLTDGRVVVIGGEYNNGPGVDTDIGFIYDPATDSWSSQLSDVFGGGNVGDASGKVLQDGTFVLANIRTTNLEALNAATGVFTARNPTGKLDVNSEETWTMLYDGTMLTVDTQLVSKYERYSPSSNSWGNSGSTPVNMADTGAGLGTSLEIGPCVQRPDNKVFCFSGNSLGQNALYNPSTNTWSHASAMDFPAATGGHFSVADGPAAALPNGNILVMASPVTNSNPFNAPSHFYELSLSTNTLTAVTDSPNAASFASYQGRMLVLPTGEVLLTAYNQGSVQDVMLYSNGGAPSSASRPIITSAPTNIAAGGVYSLSGKQLNGFSEGAAYGDDAQSATNYPLVRLTNQATGHVFYAKTYNHSRMGVESVGSATIVTTTFQAPAGLENGSTTLEVVANGIASLPQTVSTSFASLTLINGWSGGPFSTGVPSYTSRGGIIQLRGGMSTSGTIQQPFVLPVGARPTAPVYVPADLFVANAGRLFIDTAGNVTVMDEGAGFSNAPLFTSLENVSFAIDATGFTAVTLVNGWTNAPFGTRNVAVKNDGGTIRFEGAMATSGTNPVAFTLPLGFRPPTNTYIPIGLCNAKKGRLYIQTSGVATISEEGGGFTNAQCFTSLEGASFALSASGFTSVTLQNGWTNAPFTTRNVAIRNDNGIVRFEGAIGSGTSAPLFTLPSAFRPARNTYVNVDLCNAVKGRLIIVPNGTVSVQEPTGVLTDAQCFTSLEGATFAFGN